MTINKTTISGFPRQFDEQELQRRKLAYRNMYNTTMESKEAIRAELPADFLLSIIEHSKSGYTLAENLPVRFESLNYKVFMTKPVHLQISDLEAADVKIKDAYVLELQSERERYKILLKQQLLESDAAKEQKKQDAIKAKRLAEIEAEVASCFGDLEIPE